MERAQSILLKIKSAFPGLGGVGVVPAPRRIYLDIPAEIFLDVLKYAKNELKFGHLITITGLDTGEHFEFIYHVSNTDGVVLNLKREAPRDDSVIPSVLPIYEGATFYEKELEGILGVKVEGLPEGRQYPLPDNWPKDQHPLRKDWKPEMLVGESKEGC